MTATVVELAGRRRPLAGFGVDRLSLSFPLFRTPAVDDFERVSFRPGRDDEGRDSGFVYGLSVPLSGGARRQDGIREDVTSSVFVGAAQIGGAWWGKVESNPARFGDPDGCSLLGLDDLEQAGEVMWDVACRSVSPDGELDQARVKRVDLARDFAGVRSPSGYVWGLLNVKRPYAKKQYVYSDPARRNAETLWAGSGAGGVRLYDQHAAYGASKGALAGSLRWEVEARGDWLAKSLRADALSFGAMSGTVQGRARLVELAERRWEWSGMGMQVASTSDVVTKVEGLVAAKGYPDPDTGEWLPFSAAKGDRLLGMLLRESRGVDRRSCKYTAGEYGKLKRHLGVLITPQLFAEQDDSPVGRLDWASGTEHAAAA